ncbi:hypothetical protein PFISCL1PPCAC_721 [Pristionchus fissidentatus]|uniref:mannose-6-phosphate isomerase n=1 Tax=Pristionchus fissidentatus TaxID=1538716 RepID=A0AAV5UQP0_9BILA|nr:hypothetical protein PFISCL1PPCAC_721 [Pristionchus fissidentatus]
MERLDCHCNNYLWGKEGANSEVARLFAAGHPDFVINPKATYSELWMGTHPDGPARVRGSSRKLSTHIAASESAKNLSNNNSKKNNVHLPFIMKVMSIDRTLSLQVHPTKEQAVRLHARDPKNYPDEHHKPELAYALTRFELLCGFRPAKEMLMNLEAFPPLRRLFGIANCDELRNRINAGFEQKDTKCRIALAAMFKHMMNVEGAELRELLFDLFTLLDQGVRGALRDDTVDVIRKMASDFPGDVGIFGPLFLNHMVLQPGECCYYAAEELHAYLSGECVECVGCSNNTIRAACTPKYIDREALCDVLNYLMTEPEDYLVPGVPLAAAPHVDEYAPDCKDFQLHRIRIAASSSSEMKALPVLECASITVFVAGEGVLAEMDENEQEVKRQNVARGDIIYIPAGRSVKVISCSSSIEAYRTFSYEAGPDHDSRTVVPKQDIFSAKTIQTNEAPVKPRFALSYEEVFTVESEMDGMV